MILFDRKINPICRCCGRQLHKRWFLKAYRTGSGRRGVRRIPLESAACVGMLRAFIPAQASQGLGFRTQFKPSSLTSTRLYYWPIVSHSVPLVSEGLSHTLAALLLDALQARSLIQAGPE